MKDLLKLLFVLLFIIGCTSGEEEPIEACVFEDGNIIWLNEKIEDFEKSASSIAVEIYQYTYQEETVFLINDCVNCSDALEKVYNCAGEVICEFGGITGLNTCIDFDTATNKTLVYTNTNNQVIIDNDRYINTSTENHQITDVSINGDILKLSIQASGCNSDTWQSNLIDSSEILESLPVQRNIKIDFINNEECEALITKEYEFDISSLQVNGEEIVHFNLEGWTETIVYNYGEASTIEKLLLGNWSNRILSEDQTTVTFERVAELSESTFGFTFKEEFPTCIERILPINDKYLLPIPFTDLERTYTLEGDNLKIYDVNITNEEGAQPILLHHYKIVAINDELLTLNPITTEQNQDINELVELFNNIYTMTTGVSCEEVEEWSFIAYGSKACGGPQGYLPYPSNIDISVLEAAVEEYTKIEKAYNIKYEVVSNCSIIAQPTGVNCVSGIPTLVY